MPGISKTQIDFSHVDPKTMDANIKFLNEHKGKRFTFNKNGSLRELRWNERIFYSKKDFKAIRKNFNAFTRAIVVNKDNENDIKQLFLETLAGLDKKRTFYYRDVNENTFNNLCSEEGNQAKVLQEAAKAAEIWAKMGSFSQIGKGCSTSYAIQAGGKKGEKLFVFKPSAMDTLGPENPKLGQKIKRELLQKIATIFPDKVGNLFETAAGQGYASEVVQSMVGKQIAEIATSYLAQEGAALTDEERKIIEEIQAGIVPDTIVSEISLGTQAPKKGSLQSFITDEFVESFKFLEQKNKNYQPKRRANENPPRIPSEFFDALVIIDYITGNSDRHGENWLVVKDENPKIAKKIWLIDGGWSMGPAHPKEGAFELNNQYKWRNLDLANDTFSNFGHYLIEQLYQHKDEWAGQILDLYNLQNADGLFTAEKNANRIERMNERLEVLHRCQHKTKRDLGNIRTQEEITNSLASQA